MQFDRLYWKCRNTEETFILARTVILISHFMFTENLYDKLCVICASLKRQKEHRRKRITFDAGMDRILFILKAGLVHMYTLVRPIHTHGAVESYVTIPCLKSNINEEPSASL